VLIVAVLSCLPVFHNLSGFDVADAFDQGIMASRVKVAGLLSSATALLALALWSCVLCARQLARRARLVSLLRHGGHAGVLSPVSRRVALTMLRGPGRFASECASASLRSRANDVRRVTMTPRTWRDMSLRGGFSLVGARMRLNV